MSRALEAVLSRGVLIGDRQTRDVTPRDLPGLTAAVDRAVRR
jgi:hypothetical protein